MNYIVSNLELLEEPLGNDEPLLLHGFFERQAALTPHQTAVECKGESLTYAELEELANRIADYLNAMGIRPGCLVALCLKKSCRLYAALLGTQGWRGIRTHRP